MKLNKNCCVDVCIRLCVEEVHCEGEDNIELEVFPNGMVENRNENLYGSLDGLSGI